MQLDTEPQPISTSDLFARLAASQRRTDVLLARSEAGLKKLNEAFADLSRAFDEVKL